MSGQALVWAWVHTSFLFFLKNTGCDCTHLAYPLSEDWWHALSLSESGSVSERFGRQAESPGRWDWHHYDGGQMCDDNSPSVPSTGQFSIRLFWYWNLHACWRLTLMRKWLIMKRNALQHGNHPTCKPISHIANIYGLEKVRWYNKFSTSLFQ